MSRSCWRTRPTALVVNVSVPDDRELYTNRATQQVPFALLVCYPTTADNPYPDYPLPSGKAVPHMQQGSQTADIRRRQCALAGAAVFARSGRQPDLERLHRGADSAGELWLCRRRAVSRRSALYRRQGRRSLRLAYALLHFDTFVEMQALAAAVAVELARLSFSHPQYRDHLDVSRIGGFGASQGGESLLLMTGAKLTITVGMSSKQVLDRSAPQGDRRLRSVSRTAVLPRVRPRPERARRHRDAVPRDLRRSRPDGAAGNDARRRRPPGRLARRGRAGRRRPRLRLSRAPPTSSPGR